MVNLISCPIMYYILYSCENEQSICLASQNNTWIRSNAGSVSEKCIFFLYYETLINHADAYFKVGILNISSYVNCE